MSESVLLSCSGVGLMTPCSLNLASVSASAMFTFPFPIFCVGGVNVVVLLPSVSVNCLLSRSPLMSDLEFASEPADVLYLSMRWDYACDAAAIGGERSIVHMAKYAY